MVEHLQRTFQGRAWPDVIDRRAKIKQHHRPGEDAGPDEECRASMLRGSLQKDRRCESGGDQTEAVTDSIRELFASRLCPLLHRRLERSIHDSQQRKGHDFAAGSQNFNAASLCLRGGKRAVTAQE